jgi:hypothetical protein
MPDIDFSKYVVGEGVESAPRLRPRPTSYDSLIEKHAGAHGVDPDLVRRVMGQESRGHAGALSPKGASGLMQLMPDTARSLGVKNIYDPDENISAGVRYLKQQLDEFGTVPLALAAYNAGPGAVKKYGNKVPPYRETQDYVRKIGGGYTGTGYASKQSAPPSIDFSKYTVDAPAETLTAPVTEIKESSVPVLDTLQAPQQTPAPIGQPALRPRRVNPTAPAPKLSLGVPRQTIPPLPRATSRIVEDDEELAQPNLKSANLEQGLSLPARMAARTLQATQPHLSGKDNLLERITVEVAPKSGQPTQSEINDAILERLGKGWKELGQRFRSEMGVEPITADAQISATPVYGGKFYQVSARPTTDLIKALQAFDKGGKDAYYAKLDELKGQNRTQPSQLEGMADTLASIANPSRFGREATKEIIGDTLQGAAKANLGTMQLVENLRKIHEGEDPRIRDESQQAIDASRAQMPEYKTNVGGLAGEGIEAAGGLARMSVPGGHLSALLETYVENLNRGDKEALKSAAMLAPMLAAGIGAERLAALNGMSAAERQIFVRGVQGTINAAQAQQSGQDLRGIVRSGIVGAGFPVGRGEEVVREGVPKIAPTERTARLSPLDMPDVPVASIESPRVRKFQHRDFGLVTEAENQSGVGQGKIKVVDEAGAEHVIQKANGRGQGNSLAVPVREATNVAGGAVSGGRVPIVSGDQPFILPTTRSEGRDAEMVPGAEAVSPQGGTLGAARSGGETEINVSGEDPRGEAKKTPLDALPSPIEPPAPRLTPESAKPAIPDKETFKTAIQKAFRLDESRATGMAEIGDAIHNYYLKNRPDVEGGFYGRIAGIERGGEVSGDALRQSIGQSGAARLSDHTKRLNLDVAREMEAAGKDAKTIWTATGWERGGDGKWRTEIEDAHFATTDSKRKTDEFYADLKRRMAAEGKDFLDHDFESQMEFIDRHGLRADYDALGDNLRADLARVVGRYPQGFKNWHQNFTRKNNRQPTLQDVIPNAPVFQAYPKLKDIPVAVHPLPDGTQGSYNGKLIVLSENVDDPRSVIHHEVQHAIQDIEGFARGGSPKQFASSNAPQEYAWYRELKRWRDKMPKADMIAVESAAQQEYRDNDMWDWLPPVAVRDKVRNNFFDNAYVERIKTLTQASRRVDESPTEIYKRLGGEVEARNTQTRLNLDPLVRQRKPLSETEDVARESQIYLRNAGEQSRTLFQDVKGATQFLKDGRAIIKAFDTADISTAAHEVAHVFRRDLHPELLSAAESWAGVKDGKWTVQAEEKFARGFERYLKEGKAPSVQLRQVFENFKEWLTGIYGAIRGKDHPLGVKLTPEIIKVWDTVLGVPKGEHGKFTSEMYRPRDAESAPFLAHPAVRSVLGLEAIPSDATAKDRNRMMTETSDALTRALGQQRASQLPPERIRAWAEKNSLPADALEALPTVSTSAPPLRVPTQYEATGQRQYKIDAQTMSLAEAVRAAGGLAPDKDAVNAGELRRLSNKESASSGLVRRTGLNVERMAELMRDHGYDVSKNPNEFLNQVESDLRGEKTYSNQRELDYEAEYRKAHPEDSEDALISLIESGRGGTLFDKVDSGQATKQEIAEFKRLAETEYGVFPEHVRAIIAGGRQRAKEAAVQGTSGVRGEDDFAFGDDQLEPEEILFQKSRRSDSRQQGFNLDELVQERVPSKNVSRQIEEYNAGEASYQKQKAKLGDENMRQFERLLDEGTDSSVRRVVREMYRRVEEGAAVPESMPDTLAALSKLAELRRTKTPVRDFLNQGSLFGDRELTPQQERILQALDSNPRKVLDEALPKQEAESPQQTLFQSSSTSSRRQRAYRALLEAEGQGRLVGDAGSPARTRTTRGSERTDSADQPSLVPKLSPKPTLREEAADVLSLPRSLKSSVDLSAAMRQGAMFTLTHPVKSSRIFFGQQLRSLSNKGYEDFKAELKTDPDRSLMQRAGLHLTSLADGKIDKKEEAFASNLVGKIPIVGRRVGLVTRSEHAYTTFLDAARSTWFKQLAREAEKAAKESGTPLKLDEYKRIAQFVNRATGRGDLGRGKINDAAPLLNAIFFAPKYAASRVQVLDPRMYAKLPAGARKTAIREAVQYYGTIAAVATMLKYGMGANVGTDPEDSDFLKLKVGNTRYDLAAGQGQYLVLAARLLRHANNARTGQKETFGGGAWSTLDRFARYKYSPILGAARNTMEGKNAIGEKTTFTKEAFDLVKPIYLNDLYDAYQEEGWKGVGKNAPGFVGVGVQTYGDKPKKSTAPRLSLPKLSPPKLRL